MTASTNGDADRTVVIEGDATGSSRSTRGDDLRGSSRVGRYVLLSRLGQGGMGIVWLAYDPKLHREVALKVLHDGIGDGGEAHTRMLREAQALARISHPHVVAVYDTEPTEHGLCIAMEYVEGRTLRAWLREEPRSWSDALEIVLAAARGLAAVHAAGIVHRDVKPDNILVGNDGRVRLTDFGLARGHIGVPASGRALLHETGALDSIGDDSVQLTEDGTVMGTPAYMAPEQHASGIANARSDQYAMCVVLWEAVYGRRLFKGLAGRALLAAKRQWPPERPPSKVPDWIHAAIARGLAVEPDLRWPSIDQLIDALAKGGSRARRRRAILSIAAGACVPLLGAAWHGWDRNVRMGACAEAADAIVEVWNEQVRQEVHAAMLESPTHHAAVTAQKVMPWLDQHVRAWRDVRQDACVAATVRSSLDTGIYERSLWCLDERRMELESVVAELGRGDAEATDRAVGAVAALDDVETCRNVDVLRRLPSPPRHRREEVRSVRSELSRAAAQQRMGRSDEARATVEAALAQAERLDWPPLSAQARLLLGTVLAFSSDYATAEATLEAAFFEATEAGRPEIAAEAAQRLVYTVGYRLARHTDGLRWARHARTALAMLPDVAQTRTTNHHIYLGSLHFAMGAYEEAASQYTRALGLQRDTLGPEHPALALTLTNLAAVRWKLGSYDDAEDMQRRALAIREEALGPEHPELAANLDSLGSLHYARGRYDRARSFYERALALRELAHGDEHLEVASTLANLANVEYALGDFDRARALYERTLAARERALGTAHPEVAASLAQLGNVHLALGAIEDAKALHERALAIRTKTMGPDHPDVGWSLTDLGQVHRASGSYAEARPLLERALAIWEHALGHEHRNLSSPLVGLAEVELAEGRPIQAAALAQRALDIRERTAAPLAEVAEARFTLAQAWWDTSDDRTRALELARRARDELHGHQAHASTHAKVEAWLATRQRTNTVALEQK